MSRPAEHPGPTTGQALTEVAVGLAVASAVTLAGASLLTDLWNRTRCAHRVFEATHARLVGHPVGEALAGAIGARIQEDRDFVRGEARCGRAVERVELRRLEPAEHLDPP